jgi:hypothetical protein
MEAILHHVVGTAIEDPGPRHILIKRELYLKGQNLTVLFNN